MYLQRCSSLVYAVPVHTDPPSFVFPLLSRASPSALTGPLCCTLGFAHLPFVSRHTATCAVHCLSDNSRFDAAWPENPAYVALFPEILFAGPALLGTALVAALLDKEAAKRLPFTPGLAWGQVPGGEGCFGNPLG